MSSDTLSVTDNRTGRTYTLPITANAILATDLRQIVGPDETELLSFDPALRNTATCRSAITFLDGRSGTLRHRGYAIEDLATHGSYLEVAYLILEGELPNPRQLEGWQQELGRHALIHEYVKRFIDGFRYDAPPMGTLMSTVAALSTFYPDAAHVEDPAGRSRQILRLLGQVPTLAAFAHRKRNGLPFVYPDLELSYVGNFLSMMFRMTELRYEPNPVIERALDVLFLLHADHEQACSTTTMRCVGSAKTDPYSSAAAATAALYGRFHDEAYEAVIAMLTKIGGPEGVPAFVAEAARTASEPPGFGHRVYRTYDPRARILREHASKVFAVTGQPPIFETALALEEAAAKDAYFIEQALYPTVDFYETIIYHAIGFPPEMFPVLFAIPRFVGWAAQWNEMMSDPQQRTYRPRQLYTGPAARPYLPLTERT
ncbi:MAG: citrate/2-methylcitrate synthase [Candidatus Binatia bacterium]